MTPLLRTRKTQACLDVFGGSDLPLYKLWAMCSIRLTADTTGLCAGAARALVRVFLSWNSSKGEFVALCANRTSLFLLTRARCDAWPKRYNKRMYRASQLYIYRDADRIGVRAAGLNQELA